MLVAPVSVTDIFVGLGVFSFKVKVVGKCKFC